MTDDSPIIKWARLKLSQSPRRISKWTINIWKGAQHLFHQGKAKTHEKPSDHHNMPTSMAEIKRGYCTKCWWAWKTTASHIWGKWNYFDLLWETLWQFLIKIKHMYVLWSRDWLPGVHLRKKSVYAHENLFDNIRRSFINCN